MQEKQIWRHELKYSITYADYLALQARLSPVMKHDAHAGGDGRYLISSIYFDNYNDKALREKTDGVQSREKFRIRWYNDDLSRINLEKKVKHNSLCQKLSAPLTEEQCRALCDGEIDWMAAHPSMLVRELHRKMHQQQLRPRVVVRYLREPYVYAPGNVRVTFDFCIHTSLFSRDFLNRDLPTISATDFGEQMILEVKYDDFLPDIIRVLLQTEGIRQQAFSKYGASRRFG